MQPSPKNAVPRARFKSDRLKDQRNGSRSTNVFGGNFCRECHSPASVPHGVAFHSLNEEVTFPRAIVGRRNSTCVEMPTLDIVGDSVAIYVCVEEASQRGRI